MPPANSKAETGSVNVGMLTSTPAGRRLSIAHQLRFDWAPGPAYALTAKSERSTRWRWSRGPRWIARVEARYSDKDERQERTRRSHRWRVHAPRAPTACTALPQILARRQIVCSRPPLDPEGFSPEGRTQPTLLFPQIRDTGSSAKATRRLTQPVPPCFQPRRKDRPFTNYNKRQHMPR